MHTFLVASVFMLMVLSPCLVALRSTATAEDQSK
jgi:hypothetical protein